MGEKRRESDACDTGWGGEGGGAGGKKLKDKWQKETNHKQEGFQGKGKGEAVDQRKRPLSKGAGTAEKGQREALEKGKSASSEGAGTTTSFFHFPPPFFSSFRIPTVWVYPNLLTTLSLTLRRRRR